MGESMDLGNTFWKADFGKRKKNHLDRGFIKPSTEVFFSPRLRYLLTLGRGFIPRPRVYKYLDRGLKKTSVEGWTSVEVHTLTEIPLSKKL